MNDAVAWLESPECDQWRAATFYPLLGSFADIFPAESFSTWTSRLSNGPVRPEHDPCGRPPIQT